MAYIEAIAKIDRSSICADLVVKKLVGMNKPFKSIPSLTNTGLIDGNYLAELFSNNNPELQAFYAEYFKECTTYEMMKQLPQDHLKKAITDLYSRRKIGVQAKAPAGAPTEVPTEALTDVAEVAPDLAPDVGVHISTGKKKKTKKQHTGSGFDTRGAGTDPDTDASSNIYNLFNKYKIDKRKLDAGVLEIRYITNRHLIPVKPRHVSANFRKFLLEFLQSKTFDASTHYELNPDEKYLFNAIAKYIGFDLNQLDTDESFAKRWDVIMGELEAGNDSRDLKREARKYIILAQNMGMMSRDNANGIIWQYNL